MSVIFLKHHLVQGHRVEEGNHIPNQKYVSNCNNYCNLFICQKSATKRGEKSLRLRKVYVLTCCKISH